MPYPAARPQAPAAPPAVPPPAAGPAPYDRGAGPSDSIYGWAAPQQRAEGTLYGPTGGYPTIDSTMPIQTNPVESSGSLTGHILAQGWADTPHARNTSNTKVIVAMALVLCALVGISLLFVFTAGQAFTEMFSGLLK
jgi:hypothetical protein